MRMATRAQGKTPIVPYHFDSILNASKSLEELREGKIVGRRIFRHDWPEANV